MKRTASPEMLRGVFHGAMRVYLDRFLNVPPAPLPAPGESSHPLSDAEDFSQCFLTLLDTQQQVDAAGEMVYHYLPAGYPADRLYCTLVTALVREDAGFHSFQMVEGAIEQHRKLGDTPSGHLMLIAAARFLAAHAPTQRERLQTTTIAHRLHRGEMLYE